MLKPRFLPLVGKYILRHRLRSLLTLAGVALAMFLYCSIQAMQNAISAATTATANETTLVVYRQDRYCPFSSLLPEDYARQIARIPGVASVIPIKILVSNCRASLDVVTFRGVPKTAFEQHLRHLRLSAGSVADWQRRNDAVLIGQRLAERRRLKPGDRFSIAGVTVFIAGVFTADEVQEQGLAYAHLDFIQRNSLSGEGIVTQFNVTVHEASLLEPAARAIDEHFRTAQEPTTTWSEKAFTARAVTDVIELVRFAGWMGWGALAAVFALIGNAIILSVQERARDNAVLQTLGYSRSLVARLVVLEAAVLSLAGGGLGLLGAGALLHWGRFSLSVEGVSLHISISILSLTAGFGLCLLLGVGAGLLPAWIASRRKIVDCFRSL